MSIFKEVHPAFLGNDPEPVGWLDQTCQGGPLDGEEVGIALYDHRGAFVVALGVLAIDEDGVEHRYDLDYDDGRGALTLRYYGPERGES